MEDITLKPLKGKKGGGKKPHTPVEVQNNLLSKSYAKVLVAVGEGEFAGTPTAQDIYLDGTPLANGDGSLNFGGVKWEWRPGTTDQTYIQGMPEVSNEFPVGFTLTHTTPYTRLITDAQLDGVRITVAVPSLLRQADNGDVVGYKIDYAIDVATDGGAYVEVGQYSLDGKTTVEYNRTHRIDLPQEGSSWTIRVRRLTANQFNAKYQDAMTVKTFAEVVDAKFRYPNTALLYVEFDAELFGGTSIPRISVKTKGRLVQVPTNYDPEARTYSGIWNGTFKWAWTNNPAWVFYDLVVNERFGLGSRISPDMVDKWTLYQIAQHCDVMVSDGQGGLEPRHTCNMYIQSRREAWQILRDVTAIFNGMLHWSGTQLVASADMPVDTASVRTYGRSQVVDGRFQYGTPSEKTVYTTALVSYDNPDNHYETAVEAVNDLQLVQRWKTWAQAEMTAIGCTSRGEAQRKGKYAMITNSLNRVVNFKLGLDGYLPQPGEVIGVADQVLAGANFSGRIHAATVNTVTTDRDISAVAGDILYVNRANGVGGEGRTILSVAGRTITVTANFSAVPEVELGWYVEKSTLKSQLYRVTKIAWDDDAAQYEVTGVQYEDGKFAAVDNGARLELRPITTIPAGGQAAPTGLVVSSFTYIEQTMAVTTLTVKWDATSGAMQYEAQWRKDSGDWKTVGLTSSTGFDVKGIYKGDYQVRVRAINALGVKSVWTESANTPLNGKEGAPPALASFATVSEVFGIRLNWSFTAGSDDGAYIQLQEADNVSGGNSRELTLQAYPARTYLKSGMAAAVVSFFRARLIDRSGNEGPWSAWTYGISSASADEILDYLVGQITETELGSGLLEQIEKIEVIEADLNAVIPDINWIEAEVAGLEQQLQQTVADVDAQVADLHDTVDGLQDQLDGMIDALEYDATRTYVAGEVVRQGQRLYQALVSVPLNTPPPNTAYWQDIGQVITGYGALAAQVTSNTVSITQQGDTIVSQAQRLSGVETRVGNAESTITGQATAITNLQTTTTQQGNTITSQGSAITALEADMADAEADIAANGSAISSLQTTVTNQGNTITSQGSSITSLNNSLTTTNSNVTAAQAAADAANTLAGSKGKVLVQTATPGAADQLAQNLWIDITGGNNTPKRWNGSAWAAVTDKVATDAAAAAANALSVANTKADASALSSLTTRVTTAEGNITSQGNSITSLNNSLTTTNGNVTAAQAAADAAATLAGSKGKVLVQTATPAAGDQLPQNLWIDITGGNNTPKRWNGSAWVTVTDKVATDAAAAAAAAQATANTKADASAVTALTTTVTNQGNTLTSQGNSITSLQNQVNFKEVDELYAEGEAEAQIDEVRQIASATSSAVTSLTSTVTQQGDTITAQGQQITSLVAGLQGVEEDVSATGSAVETLQVTVTQQGNNLTSQASSITALQSQVSVIDSEVDGLATTVTGNSSAISTLQTTVTSQGNTLTSQGSSITALQNSMTVVQADVDAVETTVTGNTSAINSLQTSVTAIDGKVAASAQDLQSLKAVVRQDDGSGELKDALNLWQSKSAIEQERVVRADQDSAMASQIFTMQATVNENAANIVQESLVRANADSAQASQITTLQSSVDSNTASIQVNASTIASTNGSLAAMYSIKLGINSNGNYYAAGMGIGVENTPGGMQSQVLFLADRFAILNSVNGTYTSPFIVESGQVIMNNAVIGNATIGFAKIADDVQSTNYVAATTGWKLGKGGTLEFNGSVGGTGRLTINNNVLQVYDGNGVVRVRLGLW